MVVLRGVEHRKGKYKWRCLWNIASSMAKKTKKRFRFVLDIEVDKRVGRKC